MSEAFLEALRYRIPVRVLTRDGTALFLVAPPQFTDILRESRIRKGAPVRTLDRDPIGNVVGLHHRAGMVVFEVKMNPGETMGDKPWAARLTLNRRERDPYVYTVTSVTPMDSP